MIILHIIFVIGIILSVKYNNKNTLKLAMILLLYSTLLQHKKEHYNPCDNTLSVGKCKIDIPSIKGEGPSLICEKCGKNNNHCKNASDIFKPDGSCSLCINTFDNIESIKDKKDLRTCDNTGAILYTAQNDFISIKYPDNDYPNGDHFGEKLDQTIMQYKNENKNRQSTMIRLENITKIRLFKKYQLDTWSEINFSGIKKSYPIFDEYYDKFTNNNIKKDRLYDEYIIDTPIKSLRISLVNKKKILELKGVSYGFEHELKRESDKNNITLNRDSCIKRFSESDDNQFALVNQIFDNNTQENEDKNVQTNNPSINFCKFSKANFDDISGMDTTFMVKDNTSIIQKHPPNYDIIYNQSYFDKTLHQNQNQNIIQLDKTANKKFTLTECAKLCDNTETEQGPCIGFQYSSENFSNNIEDKETNNRKEQWVNNIGKCVLLNNNYKPSVKYKNEEYNIYLKNMINNNGVCKSNTPDYKEKTKSIIDKDVNFTDYLDLDKLKKTYYEGSIYESQMQEKICHDNLLKIYENPENLIIIDNININGNIIKFKFTNNINIANINIDGTATIIEDGKTKVKNIDWTDIANPHIKVSDNSNKYIDDEFVTDIDNIIENSYDNNICTYLTLNSLENIDEDIQQDDENETDPNKITLPKNAAYLEFTFKNNDTSKLINVKIKKIIIYVYNNSYVTTCNNGMNLQNDYGPDSYLPMQIDIFTGKEKSLRAQITKESMLKDATIVDLLPKIPYDSLSYNNISDFGDETLIRKWVNISGKPNNYAFCRFIEDEINPNMVNLRCTDVNDKIIQVIKPIKKSIARRVFFTQTSASPVEDMCWCENINNKTYVKCIQTNEKLKQKEYTLNIKIDKSCEELTQKIKSDPNFIKKLLVKNKLEYCGDINDEEHKPFINNIKYKIDAGFYIDGTRNPINGMVLFKNSEMNGYPVVLYKVGRGSPNIVCHSTFPGLSFNSKQLDRIDAAMMIPNKSSSDKIAYFFRSTDSKREVIKYNLTKKEIVCNQKSRIIYPRNIEDEFMMTKSTINFFKNPIIGAAYIGNNQCYLFTNKEFIEYNLNDGKTINLTNIQKISRNKRWPKMSFSKLDSVISGINNKSLIFVSKNRFTEILLDEENTVKHLNKLISKNNELKWQNLWNIQIDKLVNKISKLNIKSSRVCKPYKSRQEQVIEVINKNKNIEQNIQNQKTRIQIEQDESLQNIQKYRDDKQQITNNIKDLTIIKKNLETEISKNGNNKDLLDAYNEIISNLKNTNNQLNNTQMNINKESQNKNISDINNLNLDSNKVSKCKSLNSNQLLIK